MFDDKGLLSDRARGILFWFTIAMIIIVAVGAEATIFKACSAVLSEPEIALAISPSEATLCTGEQRQFGVTEDVDATWEATGGIIDAGGLYTAGDIPGDYGVTVQRAGSRDTAQAIVHVVACTPTPTPVPPTPVMTPTPTMGAIAPPPVDAQGDVGTYQSGAPITGAPSGVDISSASIAGDMRVSLDSVEGAPGALVNWVAEGEVLLWIATHSPIADPPGAYINWIFALDMDGNSATGRTVGSARINPDLGDEAVIGVSYNTATGAYEPYFLVWDAAQGSWATGPGTVRYLIDESRTVVGLALSRDALIQGVAQTTGVSTVPEGIKGRAAVESYAGEQRVIDFYPDRP